MSTRRHTIALLALAVGMFGFAFTLVPMYRTFCEWTGLNGRAALRAGAAPAAVPEEREVTVQFLAQVANGLPWEFRPVEAQMRVRLGAIATTRFYVRNRARIAVTGQAVPSIAPSTAATHLTKLECFCFSQQRLNAGATREMPVRFYVDKDLPRQVRTLTLSYTLFQVPDAVRGEAGS
jgi:cytochrome c oxidase assembly protein subunit 11